MKLNFVWIKKLWKTLKEDSTLDLQSVTLLDLNEDCLRHIGYYLSIEDAYSLGHTCTQLLATVSKIRAVVTIENPNELKYLNYFGEEARAIKVLTDDGDMTQEFTENDQKNLLTIMEKCTKVSHLGLITSNSRTLCSAFLIRSIRKLAYLEICLSESFCRPKFVESLENCENLKSLAIEYDSSSSDTVKELFETEFPKLKFMYIYATTRNDDDDERQYFVPLNTFLRVNNQLKCLEIDAPIFEGYLEAIALCQKLEKLRLAIPQIAEKLIPKLLILNELPVLEYTLIEIDIPASEQMEPTLKQIQSLKKLSITYTLLEDFIDDFFQIPQISSLSLTISDGTPSEIFNGLRYHEPSLYNLTELNLHDDKIHEFIDCWTTRNDLNEFIKFIINCPKLESIKLPYMFPINRFYKLLLKYEKNFGYHVRKKALYLTVEKIQWIPGYFYGRRTHNVIIRNDYGYEPDTSINSIIMYACMEFTYEMPSVLLLLIFLFLGKLIHIMQNVII